MRQQRPRNRRMSVVSQEQQLTTFPVRHAPNEKLSRSYK